MRVIFEIVLLILCIATIDSSIYSNVRESLSDYVKRSLENVKNTLQPEETEEVREPLRESRFKVKRNEGSISNIAKEIYKKISTSEDEPKAITKIFKTGSDKKYVLRSNRLPKQSNGIFNNIIGEDHVQNDRYHLDPVLNSIGNNQHIKRRANSDSETESESSDSSSLELRDWKTEFKELWIKKKIEALNHTQPQGDVVNMVAARPWGVACGDPNQHDMPWGTCVMAMECEPEYRVYRGDFKCGRTMFVCCSIQMTNYDMYQGFDISFEDSALTTDEEEEKKRGSEEKGNRKKRQDRRKRKKARDKRKKKIKKDIKKIVREIKKILNKQSENGTTQRKRKTKQLKKFIEDLKKKYRHDRKSVKNIHEIELVKIDSKLMTKIGQIKEMNLNFVNNATFRDIIVNGTMNKKGARMLIEAYPELIPYFKDATRRSAVSEQEKQKDYTDYDVEYGMLYY